MSSSYHHLSKQRTEDLKLIKTEEGGNSGHIIIINNDDDDDTTRDVLYSAWIDPMRIQRYLSIMYSEAFCCMALNLGH